MRIIIQSTPQLDHTISTLLSKQSNCIHTSLIHIANSHVLLFKDYRSHSTNLRRITTLDIDSNMIQITKLLQVQFHSIHLTTIHPHYKSQIRVMGISWIHGRFYHKNHNNQQFNHNI